MSKYVDAIIGHAVGDAMGVPTEFCIREKLLKNPVSEMISCAKVGQPAGAWSDDTSMEIATIDSYIEFNEFNYSDIMHKWSEWINESKYAANDEVFDVGRTCLSAIRKYSEGINPTECGLTSEMSNGNGSLMRILPVALYCYSKELNDEKIIELTNDISSLTHGHDTSKLGCYIYVRFAVALLQGKTKEEAYELIQNLDYSMYDSDSIKKYDRILHNNIKDYGIDDISSKGYVVDTLECALWILMNASSYREVVFSSTNIGNDTDTIGAIAGSLAGIIYGVNNIPKSWLDKLLKKDYLVDLALKFEKATTYLKKDPIIGTIIGDIAGSRFEINDCKTGKDFVLLHDKYGRFSDDTVMTLATAKSLLECAGDYSDLEEVTKKTYAEVGKKYISCGFGGKFWNWLISNEHKPYGSYGNGAAMRISPVGMAFYDIKEIKEKADIFINLSHNHVDSIKGAEVVCIAVSMALNGKTKEEIKEFINNNYFNIDDSRKLLMSKKEHHINCAETVKQALKAFLDSYDFEDAIRNAISFGGDSVTIGAITGSIAAAYYGVPENLCEKALRFLDEYLLDIYNRFDAWIERGYKFKRNRITKQAFLKINEEDVMFITNPGRMGDVDGTTFVIKKGNELTAYRISEWYTGGKDKDFISLNETLEHFSKWDERLQENSKEILREFPNWCSDDDFVESEVMYKYLNMGFGNGLSINNSIYDEYMPYLNEVIKKYENSKYYISDESIIFNKWDEAVARMAKDKGYKFKEFDVIER